MELCSPSRSANFQIIGSTYSEELPLLESTIDDLRMACIGIEDFVDFASRSDMMGGKERDEVGRRSGVTSTSSFEGELRHLGIFLTSHTHQGFWRRPMTSQTVMGMDGNE